MKAMASGRESAKCSTRETIVSTAARCYHARARDSPAPIRNGLGRCADHDYVWGTAAWSKIPPTRRAVARRASDAGRRSMGNAQIGRASCRERVEISVVAVSLKKKKEKR